MNKLSLMLFLSAASINAMKQDSQTTNPVEKIQQLVTNLKQLNTELGELMHENNIPTICAKLPQTGKKFESLELEWKNFTSSFNAEKAFNEGKINQDDIAQARSCLENGKFMIINASFRHAFIALKITMPDKRKQIEEESTCVKTLRTAGKFLGVVGLCLIAKGISDALQQ